MSRPLKILLVEDDPRDAELVLRELKRAALEFESHRVQTEPDFRRALAQFQPHIVLSDFSMPRFSGTAALRILRESRPDIPLIFVSGTIGEDVAVEAMKGGANDYVMKTNLTRLVPAIQRELRETEIRQARKVAEAGLRRAQAMAKLAHVITGPDGSFESWSETLPQLAGVKPERLPGTTRAWLELVHPEDRAFFRDQAIQAGAKRQHTQLEYRLLRADGALIHVRQTIEPLGGEADAEGRMRWFNTLQNITEQVRAGEELRRFRLAMDNSADIIALIDRASMRFIDVNAAACRLLGYSRAELLAMGPQDVLPVSRVELEKSYDAMIENPLRPNGLNSYYRCKDGSQLPFESTRCALRSADAWEIVAISRDIRERIAAERALRDSEARFRQTFELAASGMAHVGLDRRYLRVNRKLCEMLGYAENELVGLSVKDISHPEDKNVTDEQIGRVRAGELESASFEKRYLRKNGSIIWVSLTVAYVRDKAGEPQYAISVMDDITERKATQARIERLTRVHAVLSGINGAIVRIRNREELLAEACRIAVQAGRFPLVWLGMVDGGRKSVTPVAWNDLAEGFLRFAQHRLSIEEGAINPPALAVREKKPFVSNDVEHDPLIVLKNELRERGIRSVAVLPLLVSGEAVGVLSLHAAEIAFFDDEEMKLLVELAGDIAFALEHIDKSDKLDYLAYYDALTGLANRTLFHERLAQYLQSEGNDRRKLALLITDVERFKTINDSLGRQVGDQLLEQVAERIVDTCAEANEVARIGTDQFALLLPGVRDEAEAARIVEERSRTWLGSAFQLGNTELRISMKTGIAMFPVDGTDADTLFRNAEAALEKAKTSGDRYLFYTPQMTERVAEKLTLESRLRQALENDEFVLHYQPKVDLNTRRILGIEALIRWQSPDLGLVAPMKFIPLLEEIGLILEVGSWALKRAARDHRGWVEAGLEPPKIAVNVSAIQLRQRDFVRIMEQAIVEGVTPTGIDLEITESLIMEDIQASIEKLGKLRRLGVGIAIDDFGTGYSSLSYLARLPVETLKIDRSFVITMLEDPNTAMLVQTIISLAHSLRLKVVAEGVETEEQAKMLRFLRCDQMQGYLFSMPLPHDEMTALLKRER